MLCRHVLHLKLVQESLILTFLLLISRLDFVIRPRERFRKWPNGHSSHVKMSNTPILPNTPPEHDHGLAYPLLSFLIRLPDNCTSCHARTGRPGSHCQPQSVLRLILGQRPDLALSAKTIESLNGQIHPAFLESVKDCSPCPTCQQHGDCHQNKHSLCSHGDCLSWTISTWPSRRVSCCFQTR